MHRVHRVHRVHREWTNFDETAQSRGVGKQRPSTNRPSKNAIRARKNTELTMADGRLELTFTGKDPGMAFDLRAEQLAEGPYRLTFRLLGGGQGGEVFYTTDPAITLPNGTHLAFDVRADGKWQEILVELPTKKRLQQLRIDVCEGPGKASIADLQLLSQDGKLLFKWPRD